MTAPDIDKKMRMEMDASDYATGGVLLIKYENGLWRPVAFLSKSLNETERNYEIHDKEMLCCRLQTLELVKRLNLIPG